MRTESLRVFFSSRSSRRWLSISIGCVAVLVATGGAQTVPPRPPAAAATDEAVVVLTPFTVDTTKDRGYQAENTLSGSRLNSSLADTPASVSVFTKEFLQDV